MKPIVDAQLTLENSIRRIWQGKAIRPAFEPGVTPINYSTPIFDAQEFLNLADVIQTGWVAAGKWTQDFQTKMKRYFLSREFLLVNSGSSANLLMIACLCSPNVERHLKRGDRVIMPALGFPTTLAPVIQHGLVPIFVDVEIDTLNPSVEDIARAIDFNGANAIFLPHPMGFPFDAATVAEFAKDNRLWFLEDNCDALGATVDGLRTGTFGDMSSISFFPAHFITAGEGGGVVVNSAKFPVEARSLSEWGRACYCAPGVSNTCGKRFDWNYEGMPPNWDHKYTYSGIGYNLKATDMQAAILCAQADKIDDIVARRRYNYRYLRELCKELSDYLMMPTIDNRFVESPYAAPFICREGVSRNEVCAKLEAAKIETRPIFAGNILHHPGYRDFSYAIATDLRNTDRIMRDGFFVGVHPRLREVEMEYIFDTLKKAVV